MTPADRLYPARPILAVSLAVFREDRVLLATRGTPPLVGLFTLPGGVVEPGEVLADAALRELSEEVDVEAEILGFNDHFELIERDLDGAVKRHYVIASFVGAWRAGEGRVGPEATAVIWVRREEVGALATTEGLLPLLDKAWTIVRESRGMTGHGGRPSAHGNEL